MSEKETNNMTDRPHPAKMKKSGRVKVLFALAVVVVLVVSATAATQIYSAYRLPDPETTDADGLVRWLVTVDLSKHSADVQGTLAKRLEEEFGDTSDWSELKNQLTDEHCRQLWSNIQILLRPWFFAKMERYHAGSPADRVQVLDELLDQTETWQGIIAFAPPGEIDMNAPGIYISLLMDKIDKWKQRCSPEKAKQLDEFVTVVQARWLMRRFLVKKTS